MLKMKAQLDRLIIEFEALMPERKAPRKFKLQDPRKKRNAGTKKPI